MSIFLGCVFAFTMFLVGFVLCSFLSMGKVDELYRGKNHLRNLFLSVAPQCIPGEDLIDICYQIDNYIAGQNIEILELKKNFVDLELELRSLRNEL